jgi:Tol biopolymer transport system component
MRVPETGGVPAPLTALAGQEGSHGHPSFLPDGRHFVYERGSSGNEKGGIYLGSLDAKPEMQDSKRLASSLAPRYAPSPDPGFGYVLFGREGSLMALPFDARRLEPAGAAVPVAEGLLFTGSLSYSASATGVLAFRTGPPGGTGSQLLWFDRQGKQRGQIGPSAPYGNLQLSPDGRRLLVDQGTQHLWVADSRVNPGDTTDYVAAVSPDGRVAFTFALGGALGDLYVRLASGAGAPELLVKSATQKHPNHWSLDGRFLIYDDHTTQQQDLWIVPMTGDRKPIPFLVTPADETSANFSPDTKWIVYSSDESGRREVYVQGFVPDHVPAAGVGKWQISTAGGDKPRWRRDGKELYYIAPDGKMMAVPIKSTATTFEPGIAIPLFETHVTGFTPYDVAPDGRFLINTVMENAAANTSPITVVLNWTTGLKK